MFIDEISLKHFRNHSLLNLKLNKGINLIVGQNGTGKTSILEAINILSTTKSFRVTKESEIIAYNSNNALIKTTYYDAENELYALQVAYEQQQGAYLKRKFILNDISKSSRSILGKLPSLLFGNDINNGFIDRSEVRRKYFNRYFSQLDKEYFLHMSTLERVIKNKTKALRMVKEGSDEKILNYWDEQLARIGSIIIEKRIFYINSLSKFLKQDNIYEGKNIGVEYFSNDIEDDTLKREEIENIILYALSIAREKEIICTRCFVGPHRDDFGLIYNGHDIKGFASRGEQKFSIALLFISMAKFISIHTNKSPIILIDDLEAEMDNKNIVIILKLLLSLGYQVIATSINPSVYKPYIENFITL